MPRKEAMDTNDTKVQGPARVLLETFLTLMFSEPIKPPPKTRRQAAPKVHLHVPAMLDCARVVADALPSLPPALVDLVATLAHNQQPSLVLLNDALEEAQAAMLQQLLKERPLDRARVAWATGSTDLIRAELSAHFELVKRMHAHSAMRLMFWRRAKRPMATSPKMSQIFAIYSSAEEFHKGQMQASGFHVSCRDLFEVAGHHVLLDMEQAGLLCRELGRYVTIDEDCEGEWDDLCTRVTFSREWELSRHVLLLSLEAAAATGRLSKFLRYGKVLRLLLSHGVLAHVPVEIVREHRDVLLCWCWSVVNTTHYEAGGNGWEEGAARLAEESARLWNLVRDLEGDPATAAGKYAGEDGPQELMDVLARGCPCGGRDCPIQQRRRFFRLREDVPGVEGVTNVGEGPGVPDGAPDGVREVSGADVERAGGVGKGAMIFHVVTHAYQGECPVCMEALDMEGVRLLSCCVRSAAGPFHALCSACAAKTETCPMCREQGVRALTVDEVGCVCGA